MAVRFSAVWRQKWRIRDCHVPEVQFMLWPVAIRNPKRSFLYINLKGKAVNYISTVARFSNVTWFKLHDVRGSVHHSTFHKEKSNKMQQCIKILFFHIYMKLNMFRATHRPSSQCAWQRSPTTRQTTFHVWKTRVCQCSFRLLMMGDVSPETCW